MVTMTLNDMIKQKIDQLETQIQQDSMQIDSDNLVYLELLKDFWIQFCNQMQSIRDIFLYLERTYLISA